MPENLIEQCYIISCMISKNRYHIQILCGKTLIVKVFSQRVLGGDILQKYLISFKTSTLLFWNSKLKYYMMKNNCLINNHFNFHKFYSFPILIPRGG